MLQALKRILVFFICFLGVSFAVGWAFTHFIPGVAVSKQYANDFSQTSYYQAFNRRNEFLLLADKGREILKANGGNRITLYHRNYGTFNDKKYGKKHYGKLCFNWEYEMAECKEIALSEQLRNTLYSVGYDLYNEALSEIVVTPDNVYFVFVHDYIVVLSQANTLVVDPGIANFEIYWQLNFEKDFYVYTFEKYECPLFGFFNCIDMTDRGPTL